MSAVRSIIVFNGGSAGDFLRTACLEQISNFNRYIIDDNGMVQSPVENTYLKEFCKEEQRTKQHRAVDIDQCAEVENAHSYHSWFPDLTTNLFYIHYSDADSLSVVQTFIRKRAESDFNAWIKQTMPTHIPDKLLGQINQENFANVLDIFWKKNINEWQSNPMLTPIPLQDLFELTSLTKWAVQLCNQPLTDPAKLTNTHQTWLSKNFDLLTSLT